MNIFEFLSFDFQEFITSRPGILIIIGIVFLVIGVVMLLIENKKGKTTSEVASNTNETQTTETVQPTTQTETTTETTVETQTPVVESINATPVVVPSEGDGVQEVPVAQVAETINFNETTPVEAPVVAPAEVPTAPVVESLEPSAPVVTETLNTPTPVVPETLETTPTEVPTVAPVEAPVQPTVYGGVSPEVLKPEVLEEKPREIYGGANPLENTSPIPTANVNAAYNAEPKTVVETPTVAPVVEIPSVAPVVATQPVAPVPVVETPAVVPTVPEVVTTPVAPVQPTPVVETPTVAPVIESPLPETKNDEVERLEF